MSRLLLISLSGLFLASGCKPLGVITPGDTDGDGVADDTDATGDDTSRPDVETGDDTEDTTETNETGDGPVETGDGPVDTGTSHTGDTGGGDTGGWFPWPDSGDSGGWFPWPDSGDSGGWFDSGWWSWPDSGDSGGWWSWDTSDTAWWTVMDEGDTDGARKSRRGSARRTSGGYTGADGAAKNLRAHTWTAGGKTAVAACTDVDGNGCDFAFAGKPGDGR